MRIRGRGLVIFFALFIVANSCYAISESTDADKTMVKDDSVVASPDMKKHKTSFMDKFKKNKTIETVPFNENVSDSQEKNGIVDEALEAKRYKAEEIMDGIVKQKEAALNPQNLYSNDIHSAFSLEDCVKISIEYNPVVRSAVYSAQVQKTKIGQAWSKYFPVLTLELQGAREGTNISNSDSSVSNTIGYLPKARGDWMLFDFGKTKAAADSAKKSFESKKSTTQETVNVLIYNIKKAYYDVLFAQAQVKVYVDTVKDYELQYQQALSFYLTGKKAKIDVITAKYNLGKAQLKLVDAQNTLQVANVTLAKVMGIPEYSNFELTSQLSTLKMDVNLDDALNKAQEVRPELIASKQAAEAAKLNLRAKQRTYAPDLGLFGGLNNGRGNEFNSFTYEVGLGLSYKTTNFMLIKKQVDEARMQYMQAMSDWDTKKHDVYLNVKKAYMNMKTSEESITIAKLALDEAEEQYRQVSGRYKAGVGDYIELKDGETTYLNARLDFYNTLLKYNTDTANLEKEIGVPLSYSNVDIIKTLMKKK